MRAIIYLKSNKVDKLYLKMWLVFVELEVIEENKFHLIIILKIINIIN